MDLSNELKDGLTPLLQELLEQEENMVVAEEESKRSELRENIQRRKALLLDDERLDSEFMAYVDALPEDGQPQSRPQERRLFNEWESGLKNDLASWQSALAGIQNQPNAPIVFSNAQRNGQPAVRRGRENGFATKRGSRCAEWQFVCDSERRHSSERQWLGQPFGIRSKVE